MTRRRSAAALAALLILSVIPAAAGPVLAADGGRGGASRTLAYWTEARMRSAVPRDYVRGSDGTFRPLARPAPGGGGGNTAGASWPNGKGLVYAAVGKVWFSMGGRDWICSGAVVNDGGNNGYSLVLTAAHCAYDEAADEFATNWMFIPEFDSKPTYDCPATAYGCWAATRLVVHNGYASRESFDDEATWHDFAVARVEAGGKGGSVDPELDQEVGSFGITFSSFAAGTRMYAFGYPAAQKYKGNDLTYCAGPVFYDPYNSEKTYGMTCNMTGGSSGGPWFSSFTESTGTGTLSSLNSYGYSGVKAMHGPKFGTPTQNVYNAAKSSGGNAVVN